MDSLAQVRCFLLDMDGTIYLGNQLLEGTLEFLSAVTASGRSYCFLTNNSSRSGEYYIQKLERMGIHITPDQLLTSGQATAQYLLERHPGQRIFLLGNSFLKEEMIKSGISVVDDQPDLVVVGYDTTITYESMCAVCDHVRNGLPYIATHPDFNCPTETGFVPDIGAIMAFIHASTGRNADVIIGKPHGHIVTAAAKKTGFSPSQMAICGDRLYTDIRTGTDHGLTSILVFTGETTTEDLAASSIQPTIATERLSDLIPYLQEGVVLYGKGN